MNLDASNLPTPHPTPHHHHHTRPLCADCWRAAKPVRSPCTTAGKAAAAGRRHAAIRERLFLGGWGSPPPPGECCVHCCPSRPVALDLTAIAAGKWRGQTQGRCQLFLVCYMVAHVVKRNTDGVPSDAPALSFQERCANTAKQRRRHTPPGPCARPNPVPPPPRARRGSSVLRRVRRGEGIGTACPRPYPGGLRASRAG